MTFILVIVYEHAKEYTHKELENQRNDKILLKCRVRFPILARKLYGKVA